MPSNARANGGPDALAHRGLQDMMDGSAPVTQLRAVTDMIRESPRVKQAVPYQAMAEGYARRQRGAEAAQRRSNSSVWPAISPSAATADVIQGAFINKTGAPLVWVDTETGNEYEQVEARVDNRIKVAGHGERFSLERENGEWVRRFDATPAQSMDVSPRDDSPMSSMSSEEEDDELWADAETSSRSEEQAKPRPDHERLGLVSWNVQHFSDHDVETAADELATQLEAFDGAAWARLFKEFAAFAGKLRTALDTKHASDTFKRLQNVESRLASLNTSLRDYHEFLTLFDIDQFAAHIESIQHEDWRDAIRQSNDSPSKRILLRRLVDEFKYVENHIDSAGTGFDIMNKMLGQATIIERMDPGLKGPVTQLQEALSAVRKSIVNKSKLDTFRKALHSHNIVVHIDEMFARNQEWLDVVVLQEINDTALLENEDADYTVHRGPHMKSNGGRDHGQNEYYPLLVRKDSGVKVVGTYMVTTSGELKAVADDEDYPWKKTNDVYRPIMAYRVRKTTPAGEQDYMVGVVHTTPEVDGGLAEFNRRAIYDEVSEGLATLKAWAQKRKLPLIVGGDYYLSAEAVVREPTRRDLTVFNPKHDEDALDETADGSRYLDEDDREELRQTQTDIEAVAQMLRARKRELEKERLQQTKNPNALPESMEQQAPSNTDDMQVEAPEPQAPHAPQLTIKTRSARRAERQKQQEKPSTEPKESGEPREPIDASDSTKSEEEILIAERLKFLAAAKTDAQVIRNVRDLTVKAQVERLGLYLGQAISGTNPKANPLARWFDLQIADFFIHNAAITGFRVGIVRPEGGMVPLDREDLYYSRYWQHFSDHFPVGGIYSVAAQGVPGHLGRRGQYSEQAVELARVSNVRRFARLALIDEGLEPDLGNLSETQIEALALEELHHRIKEIDPHGQLPENIEECISLIQYYERRYPKAIPEDVRLFVTEPGDFEPDYNASGAEEPSIALPSSKRGNGGTGGRGRREGRFLLDHRQALQSGWNCGDLALQVNRRELVAWLLQRANDPLTRALLAPEIRTAAAASFMNQALPSKESGESKDKEKEETKESADEKKLKAMFQLLDDAKEAEVRSEIAAQIHDLLSGEEASASSRHGLPEAMMTQEVGNLLQTYYDAHEAMAPIVSQVNDELGLHGVARLDGAQLGARLSEDRQLKASLQRETWLAFKMKLATFRHADEALTDYTQREDVFRQYVTNYYGQQGWMVYHLEFGGAQHASTSIIDLAAQFRQTQVRIWVYQNGDFHLNRETEQYGQGVLNILYNGYNHFIGLTDNPDFAEAPSPPLQ